MKTLEINLSEQTAAKLTEAARKLKVSPEELLVASVEEKLAQLELDFARASRYVLDKNVELYERLA